MAFLWILIWIGLGKILQRTRFAEPLLLWLNRYLIWVAVPAVTLHYLRGLSLSLELLFPVAVAWICFAGACVFWMGIHRLQAIERRTLGGLILLSGLGNTSFLGFPLMQYFYGQRGLEIAALIDQPGSFLVLSTLGIGVAAHFSGADAGIKVVFQRVLFFPPFIAFLTVMLLNFSALDLPAPLWRLLALLSASLIPLALVSVGLQLRELSLNPEAQERRWVLTALGYKMLLAPLGIAGLYTLLGYGGVDFQICVLEAGMAPMITGSIVASRYDLNPALCMKILSWGIVLSLLSIPSGYALLQGLSASGWL